MTTNHLMLIVADAHTRSLRCAAQQRRRATRGAVEARVTR